MANRLRILDKAEELAVECYNITKKLPKEETYALSSQMRRCAVSVGSNVAEGQARNSNKDFLHFLHIARGSLSELEFQNKVMKRIHHLEIDQKAIDDTSRLLYGLIKKVKEDIASA